MNNSTPHNPIERRLISRATATLTPISGSFELTPLCNLHCLMCYLRISAPDCMNKGGMKPLHFWLDLAKQMKEAGTFFLLLTGGEPFLYPDFKELYTRLIDMGFVLTLNTNGTLIDKENARFLAEHMPRRVNVTLYGTCHETYQKVTGSASAYDLTMNGIRNLTEAGVPVKMNVSLIPENVDELDQFYDIANELGIPLEVNTYMYPVQFEDRADYDKMVRLTPEQAAKADLRNDERRMPEERFKMHMKEMAMTYQYLDRLHIPEPDEPELLPCRAARSSFWVNWKGEMTSCVFLEQGKMDLEEHTFEECWKQMNETRSHLALPKKCSSCVMRRFCLMCGAAAYHEKGDMGEAPDYLCAMTKEKLRLAYELAGQLGMNDEKNLWFC